MSICDTFSPVPNADWCLRFDLVSKPPRHQAARPSVVTLSLTVSAIAVTYITSMVVNRQLTGVWPYSIMDSLDTHKK